MEPADFQFTVLPLGILVFLLVAGVFYFAQREERQKKKLARVVGSYVRYRRRQEKMFAEELEHLETLFRKELIDKETYVRLRELLEGNIERKRQQARRSLKVPENVI